MSKILPGEARIHIFFRNRNWKFLACSRDRYGHQDANQSAFDIQTLGITSSDLFSREIMTIALFFRSFKILSLVVVQEAWEMSYRNWYFYPESHIMGSPPHSKNLLLCVSHEDIIS